MATIKYDIDKALAMLAARAASKLQEALADFRRVAPLSLASASANGNAGQDATWSVVEGPDSEYGIVAGENPGVNGRAWFTAVDTLGQLSVDEQVKDALEKIDKGA